MDRLRLGHPLLDPLLRLADVVPLALPQAYVILEQLNDIFTRMTSPFLRPFRRLLPAHQTAGIDWSPLLLLLAIFILRGRRLVLLRELVSRG